MRKPSMITRLASAVVAATLLASLTPVLADDGHKLNSSRDDEQEQRDIILDAVRRGQILPLPKLREVVLRRWPGELVALKVDRDDGRIRYEFRILRPDGRLTEIEVDAADGSVLEVENE